MTYATDKQISYIKRLAAENGWEAGTRDGARFLGLVGVENWASLRVYQASALIAALKREAEEKPQ